MSIRLVMKILGLCLAGLAVIAVTAWGAAAFYVAAGGGAFLRTVLAAGVAAAGLLTIGALFAPRWRGRALAGFIGLFAVLLVWWGTLAPSNDRDWQAEVALPPYATVDGDRVTVHNIRNFDYRTESDFTPAHYDRTYDLGKLAGVDLIASYWMGPSIAHIILSFDFQDGDHLAVSIETRKERGESYSTVNGFFRQYELFYVVADERDVIRLRTNYRKNPPEDVYVYRVNAPVENARRVFLQYIEKINSLRDEPAWYNTLFTNCTTAIWMHARINPGHPPLSWKILLSGYAPEYLYEIGMLDSSQPFSELNRRAHINARAQAADKAVDFSREIRVGLPGGNLTATP